MAKHITYREEARKALERGFDLLTEAVGATLGPKGRNVVLEKKFGAPQIVNDGITIAKEIELENHVSMATELEVTEGMRFDKGYISPYFVTDSERMETVLEDPYILLTDKKITLVQDLVPILEQASRSGKPLLIVAEQPEPKTKMSAGAGMEGGDFDY
jgi:chaperonin GroEL